MNKPVEILGCKGCGSAIAEAFLTLAKIPYARVEVDYDKPGPARDRLLSLNPLVQVPTLVLPDGKILTESLAVAGYAHQQAPEVGILAEDAPEFWRWACFLIAAVYPTFTYGDSPEKWVAHPEGAAQLRASTDEWRKQLWRQVEEPAGAPYFLGRRFSAVDVYVSVMARWRPRQEWFAENAPKLSAIAERVAGDARLAQVWADNFQ